MHVEVAGLEPDVALQLGDYIYQDEAGRNGKVRTHLGHEIESLDDVLDMRQYRTDQPNDGKRTPINEAPLELIAVACLTSDEIARQFVAIRDGLDQIPGTLDDIKFVTAYNIQPVVAWEQSIRAAIET